MTIEKTSVGLRERLVSNRIFIAIELAIVLALIAADQFGLIRVPLTLTLPLLLIGWLSLRLRGLGWRDVGLRAPSNWKKTIVLALTIATIHQLISTFVLIPFLQQVTGQAIDLSLVDQLEGNLDLAKNSSIVATCSIVLQTSLGNIPCGGYWGTCLHPCCLAGHTSIKALWASWTHLSAPSYWVGYTSIPGAISGCPSWRMAFMTRLLLFLLFST